MPWISRMTYNSLVRAANSNLVGRTKNTFRQTLNPTGMLLWRLSGAKEVANEQTLPLPFEYIDCIEVEETYIVFVVHKGKPYTFEDGKELYPSDGLVAKLKLIL